MLRFKFRSIVVANLRRLMLLLAAAAFVLSPAAAPADLGDQLFKLLPDDGAEGDRFGWSVAISGTTAIGVAPFDFDNGTDSGSAYLFDITTGQQIAKLLPDDGAEGDWFGMSVAISGATAIVAAWRDDDNGDNSGSAYLFDTTTAQQIAKLLPKDGAAGDAFGVFAAISDATAIVGAWRDDDNGDDSGSAYLFDTTTGQQIYKLLANDGAADDRFGSSVAISGVTAIVGAYQDDDNGPTSGSAYLFDTTTGEQIAKLLPDDGEAGDSFGISVAISGTTAIVGTWLDDDNGTDSGSAYLFDTTTGQQLFKLLPDDGAGVDLFGIAVAISGTTAIVGTWLDDDNGTDSGSAYLFDTTTGQQIAKLLPNDGAADDNFGRSVAISSVTAIVGALRDDDNGAASGSAYLFDAAVASDCPEDSDGGVTICHIPPGDPGNAHTIRVSAKAVPAHLAHGDHCGPCEEGGGPLKGSSGDVKVAHEPVRRAMGFDCGDPESGNCCDPDNGTPSCIDFQCCTIICGFDPFCCHQNGEWNPDCAEDAIEHCDHLDCNGSNDYDGCDILNGKAEDCNENGVPDECDVADGTSSDDNADGIPDECQCPADFDGDGAVGPFDLALLLGNWGPCADPDNCPADLDGNDEVGPFDLALVLGNWGPCK